MTKNDHFLRGRSRVNFVNLCIHIFELSAGGAKRDVGKGLNVLARNVSWPNDLRSRSTACRAAQDLVDMKYCGDHIRS